MIDNIGNVSTDDNIGNVSTDEEQSWVVKIHKGFLSPDLCNCVNLTSLGLDPTSSFFAKRLKNIRFTTILSGQILLYTRNYFVQNESYNDFSGGIPRLYDLIPQDIVELLAPVVNKFVSVFNVPDKTIMIMQLQTSKILGSRNKGSRSSVTGQGIHTDGHVNAAIVCIHRGEDIEGAHNAFYYDLYGNSPVIEPTILFQGDIAFWKDNSIYHTVSRSWVKEKKGYSFFSRCGHNGKDNERTMLLLHSPAEESLFGSRNDENDLGRKSAAVKLRATSETD